MAERPSWNSEYEGSPPWDIGRPQPDFVRLADAGKLAGQVLDVGCGTGEQVMLAATHGAEALGVDIAELAIQRAREKAQERGILATFQVGDVMHLDRLGRQFDVITDSGLFHVFSDSERPAFVSSLRSALRPGGTYYMMCFSDEQPGDWGPRRVSKAEIRASFTDGWSVRSIEPAQFAIAIAIESERAQAWLATIERL
ncbi:MAG: class I SAM-dependent methyltransferase [Chloroflexi bacterium]|nr:MAG: class I SAM-dependent methyltransferase [Chloroflexota bacterium]